MRDYETPLVTALLHAVELANKLKSKNIYPENFSSSHRFVYQTCMYELQHFTSGNDQSGEDK